MGGRTVATRVRCIPMVSTMQNAVADWFSRKEQSLSELKRACVRNNPADKFRGSIQVHSPLLSSFRHAKSQPYSLWLRLKCAALKALDMIQLVYWFGNRRGLTAAGRHKSVLSPKGPAPRGNPIPHVLLNLSPWPSSERSGADGSRAFGTHTLVQA